MFRKAQCFAIGSGFFFAGCLDQYNPAPFWEKYTQERIVANAGTPKLTSEGKLPQTVKLAEAKKDAPAATTTTATATVGGVNPADEKYKMFCISCHGEDGKSKTTAGLALKPAPRDFTDAAWHNTVTDEHIEKVIRDGGPSVGKSATMSPWGAMLPGTLLKDMVKKVRSFKGK